MSRHRYDRAYVVIDQRIDGRPDKVALVPSPSEPGRWLRTHVCVIVKPCEACGARIAEPCRRAPIGRGKVFRIWHGRAVVTQLGRGRHISTPCKVRRVGTTARDLPTNGYGLAMQLGLQLEEES